MAEEEQQATSELPPIIIKKIKKGGHGHHGGAWKVAYADFVTAMMAFFLLMWLLNATEAENLAGLADYFAPTVGVQGQMGIGFRGGKGALSSGIGADNNTNRGIVFGGVPSGPIMKVTEIIQPETEEVDMERVMITVGADGSDEASEEEKNDQEFEQLHSALSKAIQDIAEETNLEDSIDVVENREGLEIRIRDNKKRSMFERDSDVFHDPIKDALQKIAVILGKLPNYISISGHTSSVPVFGRDNYSNWELSADRANATRRTLLRNGVQPEQIARVVGMSDNDPLDKRSPEAPGNNRISITLLRDDVLPQHKRSAPRKTPQETSPEGKKETAPSKLEDALSPVENSSLDINKKLQKAIQELENNKGKIEEGDAADPIQGLDAGAAIIPEDLFGSGQPEPLAPTSQPVDTTFEDDTPSLRNDLIEEQDTLGIDDLNITP